ncbi:MAG: ammonium transporter, partial [Pseudomonadota bacterium]
IHGVLGFWGVMAAGIFGMGYPALQTAPEGMDMPTVSIVGQFVGAVSMFLLGFVPGYVLSLILKVVGLLRVGQAAELAGLDPTKVPLKAYPEGIVPSATPGE